MLSCLAILAKYSTFLHDVRVARAAGQKVGIKQVDDRLWLTSFMTYDLGYFDEDSCRLEPIEDPFGSKVLPMSSE